MTSDYVASSDRQIDGNELESVWKEAALAHFMAPFQNLLKKWRNTMITTIRIAAVPSKHPTRDLSNICRNCFGLSQFTKYFEVYKPNVMSIKKTVLFLAVHQICFVRWEVKVKFSYLHFHQLSKIAGTILCKHRFKKIVV